MKEKDQAAYKPGSVTSRPKATTRRPFIWDIACTMPLATYPDDNAKARLPKGRSSLFGLAPGGACRAPFLTVGAVGSYPTVSPLPRMRGGLISAALSLNR